ncbi:very-long-chain 3-oxoacyl-CoA reductase-B-like [Gastrophryne carolinensis]
MTDCVLTRTVTVLAYLALSYLVIKQLYKLLKGFRVHILSRVWRTDLRKYGGWAVVTGATDGIGKAYARELARRGFNIVLISRTLEKLQKVAEQIEQESGRQTKVIQADFTRGSELYPKIEKDLKDVDIGILVNNVGMVHQFEPVPYLRAPGDLSKQDLNKKDEKGSLNQPLGARMLAMEFLELAKNGHRRETNSTLNREEGHVLAMDFLELAKNGHRLLAMDFLELAKNGHRRGTTSTLNREGVLVWLDFWVQYIQLECAESFVLFLGINDMLNCNVQSMLQMIRIVLPRMVQRKKGLIINVSSEAGVRPLPLNSLYSATKVFMDFFSRSLNIEYRSKGITVQSVMPLFVSTNMTQNIRSNLFVKTADDYAREALNTVGLTHRTSGCLSHSIQSYIVDVLLPDFIMNSSVTSKIIDIAFNYVVKKGKKK